METNKKATITNLTVALAEQLHKDGYFIYATDEGTFEIEKVITEKNGAGKKQEKEAENFEEEFKKMLADIAHDETIPF